MGMTSDVYESEDLLHQYLLFHYGSPEDQLPWPFGPRDALDFPARCVSEGFLPDRLPPAARALDIGCAVGRSTFELARMVDFVIGIDFSDTFIMAARTLAREGHIPYSIKQTGTITRPMEARRPADCPGQIQFEQGDATDLRPDLGSFDAVLAANLLCRLPNPRRFLQRLPDLVRPGGQLVITTPNTWLESFTAPSYWLGATPDSGEPLEALTAELQPDFRREAVWDMPFLIREHHRKYQWSVAQASRWIRHSDD